MANLKIQKWFKVYRWRTHDGGTSGTGLVKVPLTDGEIIHELRKGHELFLDDNISYIDIKPYNAPDSEWRRYDQYGHEFPAEDEGCCIPLYDEDMENYF